MAHNAILKQYRTRVFRCLTLSSELPDKSISPSEAEGVIRKAIDARLYTAPLHLLNTNTGLLCDREAQISAFKITTEYKQLLLSIMKHANFPMERIADAVATYFRYVMLSHRWGENEPLLHDIQDKIVYKLNAAGLTKLQSFCRVARQAGIHWALQHTVAMDEASKFYEQLTNVNYPRFSNCRLRLPCIIFPVIEVRRRPGAAHETLFTYGAKADGLYDLVITTEQTLGSILTGKAHSTHIPSCPSLGPSSSRAS